MTKIAFDALPIGAEFDDNHTIYRKISWSFAVNVRTSVRVTFNPNDVVFVKVAAA
jgi:hypothetical protein